MRKGNIGGRADWAWAGGWWAISEVAAACAAVSGVGIVAMATLGAFTASFKEDTALFAAVWWWWGETSSHRC